MSVDEVAASIAANGYYKYEPLLVIPEVPGHANATHDKFIVVEGNRRLAAVRLLVDTNLRRKLKATDLPLALPRIKDSLQTLPAVLFVTRQELWPYLGFKHVNGIKVWDSYSKAKYVAFVHETLGVPLDEVAKRIGDRNATVQRMYRGVKLVEQAESQTSFRVEDRVKNRFYFSHVYTAADQREYQEFLGIDPLDSLGPNPVKRNKLKNLQYLMLWLYGSKALDKEPIIRSQNPDLNNLGEIITNQQALAALIGEVPFDRSYEISIGDERRFSTALIKAKDDLQQASATVITGFRGSSSELETGKQILDLATKLLDDMRKRSENKARS